MNTFQKTALGFAAMLTATLVYPWTDDGIKAMPQTASAKVRGLDNPMQSHVLAVRTDAQGQRRVFDRRAVVESGTMQASRADSYQVSLYLNTRQ